MSFICSLEIKKCGGMLETMLVPLKVVTKLVLSHYNDRANVFLLMETIV